MNRKIYAGAEAWLKEERVPQSIIDKMFNSASTTVYWLSDDEIDAIGFRPAWLEEWVLTKCPGLLTAEMALLDNPRDPRTKATWDRFAKCEFDALRDDRTRAFDAITNTATLSRKPPSPQSNNAAEPLRP
jgi:hypothetical protein